MLDPQIRGWQKWQRIGCLSSCRANVNKHRLYGSLFSLQVTNIGRRERPRWTDERIRQILPPKSVPNLEEFHVSCLPREGFSSESSHRFLQLTQSTVHYLTENFQNLKTISGIESWNPKETSWDQVSSYLNRAECKFAVISL